MLESIDADTDTKRLDVAFSLKATISGPSNSIAPNGLRSGATLNLPVSCGHECVSNLNRTTVKLVF